MEIRQLEYFLAIAESGSMSKASTVLGIAQPSLSRQIRLLEQDLRVQLFYRHGRGIRLTEEGAQFRAAVAPIIRDLLQIHSDLSVSASQLGGSVTFGVPPSFSAAIGAPLVRLFLEKHPDVKLHIVDGFSGHVNEWLTSGRIDMAIINSARRAPSIRMDPLMDVDLFFMAHADLVPDLEEGDTISFRSLARLPLILPGRHHGLRRAVDAAAQNLGIEPTILVEIDALEALKELVRARVGSTILPHGVIKDELQRPDIVVRRVTEPDIRMQFMLAFSLHRPMTAAMRELAKTVRHQVRSALLEGRLAGRLV